MSLNFPGVETSKQIVGEYPLRQVGDKVGLYDKSDATYGNRPATNFEVLEVLAKLAGGAIYLADPTSVEGRGNNTSVARNYPGQTWAIDLFVQAVVFERPI